MRTSLSAKKQVNIKLDRYSHALVEEALRWLPEEETQAKQEAEQTWTPSPATSDRDVPGVQPQDRRARILLADDNADMREYISRFDLQAVTDGQAALDAARAEPPDLVISDIMMAKLDGFGLLLALRADPHLREVPIILLSARAGEESCIEGMEAGANDYLIKPFSARELLARVGAHLAAARVRRETAEKIRSREADLRDFVENASVGLHRVSADGIILWANRTELDLLGYTRDEYVGHSIAQFHVDASVSEDILTRLGRGENVRNCRARMRCKDGSIRRVLINSSGYFEDGKFVHSRCFTRDITEHKWAQDADALLSAIVDSSDDAIISKDLNGVITSWNKSAERLFGYMPSEAVGRSITMLIPPDRLDEEPKILERLKHGERVDHFETIRVRKDGSRLDISLTISPVKDADGRVVGASKVARDITEHKRIEQERHEFSRELEKQVRKRTAELEEANRALLKDMEERQKLEEQFHQSQKLESVGVLAAGVAHDLNNLLNIIQGYASVIGPDAPRDEIGESVDAITETTKRGAALVQQLLTLARKTEIKKESVDINTLIERLSRFIKETFPKNIETTLDLSPILPSILADANQINQVLLNLCVNARDAMSAGGKVLLKTSVVKEGGLEVYGALEAQPYVSIEITDTGTGMDEYVQSKMFEPFFTTKEIGKGTGLGLAVVYGIVKSHNGFIEVTSQPMRGTTFRLYFPTIGG